jgi:hypothetical protein
MADDEPDFVNKIERAIGEIVTLKIITYVGKVDLGEDRSAAEGGVAMRTLIDLVQGDIRTEMDPAFVDGKYAALRDFHAKREEQAGAIIRSNLDALERLIKLLVDAKNAKKGT